MEITVSALKKACFKWFDRKNERFIEPEQIPKDESELFDYVGKELRGGNVIVLKRVGEGKMYTMHRLSDFVGHGNYSHDEIENLCRISNTQTIDDFVDFLADERWTKISIKNRLDLYKIALTPKDKGISFAVNSFTYEIRNTKDPMIQRRLEIELEGAIQAQKLGYGPAYLDGFPAQI